MNRYVSGWMNVRTSGWVDGWIEQSDRYMDSWVDRERVDGWVDKWMVSGRLDEKMDG